MLRTEKPPLSRNPSWAATESDTTHDTDQDDTDPESGPSGFVKGKGSFPRERFSNRPNLGQQHPRARKASSIRSNSTSSSSMDPSPRPGVSALAEEPSTSQETSRRSALTNRPLEFTKSDTSILLNRPETSESQRSTAGHSNLVGSDLQANHNQDSQSPETPIRSKAGKSPLFQMLTFNEPDMVKERNGKRKDLMNIIE
jgi:hypothetical protein